MLHAGLDLGRRTVDVCLLSGDGMQHASPFAWQEARRSVRRVPLVVPPPSSARDPDALMAVNERDLPGAIR